MAFNLLLSELKWLLITFTIGLQEGQNLLPADSLPLYSFFVPHSGLCYQAGELQPGEFTVNFHSRKQKNK